MSHQRYPSHDPIKEPHSISLKVLRLSRPFLVLQYPVQPPLSSSNAKHPPAPASLAYAPSDTNPEPFILSPALNLPLSFGSAYVGETFSCTLCANHDMPDPPPGALPKKIRDVRIEAEMKTPGSSGAVTKLELEPPDEQTERGTSGVDLDPGQTLQKVVSFDLKEEGNHVLAVTVSYYEATDFSGKTRTFRKLYQFICKSSLTVRTKAGPLPPLSPNGRLGRSPVPDGEVRRRWVLEAQLENCSEDVIQLERIGLELEDALEYTDCNWEVGGAIRPVLHPGEVEQVCFVVKEQVGKKAVDEADGRTLFGVLGIGWRGEMGDRGYLTTGQLGSRGRAPK